MKYFKIQKGFGIDDYITIDETEVAMARRAMITGKIADLKGGMVSGKIIQSITPDWNKIMGWNRDYKLTGEDYEQIGEKTVNEYRNYLEEVKIAVENQLTGGNKMLE